MAKNSLDLETDTFLRLHRDCIPGNHVCGYRKRLPDILLADAPDEEDVVAQQLSQHGIAYKRQHRLAYFIVDFYLPDHNLVIEVDGGYHTYKKGQQKRDNTRAAILRSYGIRTIRIKNEMLTASPGYVIERVNQAIGR